MVCFMVFFFDWLVDGGIFHLADSAFILTYVCLISLTYVIFNDFADGCLLAFSR